MKLSLISFYVVEIIGESGTYDPKTFKYTKGKPLYAPPPKEARGKHKKL